MSGCCELHPGSEQVNLPTATPHRAPTVTPPADLEPGDNLWIASFGEGVVAPVEPSGAIRLHLVDVLTDAVYDESTLSLSGERTVPTGGGNSTPARPATCPSSNFDVPIAGRPGDGCNVGYDDVSGEQVEVRYFTADRFNAAPAGLFKPVSGFGRVWGSSETVRNMLGWGTAPEQPYTATFEKFTASDGLVNYYLSLPDGRVAHLRAGSRWAWKP